LGFQGFIETSVGVGFSLGPALGGGLYTVSDKTPASTQLVLIVIVIILIAQSFKTDHFISWPVFKEKKTHSICYVSKR